ncbi:MAG: 3-oxoacyl-[acyl-carrier-protein] reductase [SAR324 cluster bacterium]|nr:3-oxoacyl-[acyl-carrier-protein] reductase [SAR324 cluster bacterium]
MIGFDLQGKTALVTGGTRGIGKEVVRSLSLAGAKVAFLSTKQQTADLVVQEFKNEGLEVISYIGDQAKNDDVARIVELANKDLGKIDILVNNAGITRDNLLIRMSEEEWTKVIDTNLTGVFHITKAVVKLMMKKRFGRVVSISSVVGFSGNAGQANYSATKGAIVAFSKSLSIELAARNINFNVVAPGFINTDMTKDLPEAVLNDVKAKIPLKRVGKAQDIANGVVFLCSPLADYITGTTLHINGGMY